MFRKSHMRGGWITTSCQVTLLGCLAASSGWARAQQAEAGAGTASSEKNVEEIIVTGTHIKGVDIVGAPTITLTEDDMDRTGITNTADLLQTLPQVLSLGTGDVRGGATFQGAELNTSGAKGINLRGLGTSATLTLVNNRRVPPQGPNLQLFDSQTIPLIALDRVEVVADGASATYGSDAVTGVVNYVMRKPFSGFETGLSFGVADGSDQWKLSQLVGAEWTTGGLMLAGEYSHRDRLNASERPSLYIDDFSAFGGAPYPNFATPGNVVIGGVSYAIPEGMAEDLEVGDLGAPGTVNRQNSWTGTDAMPELDAYSVVLNLEQSINDGVGLFFESMVTNREMSVVQGVSNSTITVPHSNPYSPCNPSKAPYDNPYGITCDGESITVQYSFANELPNQRDATEEMWYALAGVNFDLPAAWAGTFYHQVAESSNESTNGYALANRGANVNVATGAPPPGVPYFNPFCDGSPDCNDPATISFIRGIGTTEFELERDHTVLSFNGPLLSMPGGDLMLAVGGEYLVDDYVNTTKTYAYGATPVPVYNTTPTRKVKSAFGELYVPIVGASNAVTGIKELVLSLAVRYEDYSDFGSTSNPKFGLGWQVTDSLKLKASYGTAFRAPSLADLNPDATAALLPRTIAGSEITTPDYVGPDGIQGVSTVVGGNSGLRAEEATTWSAGFEWSPLGLDGLFASVSYYNIEFTDRIGFPAYDAGPPAVNLPEYAPYIVLNPAYFTDSGYTQDEYDEISEALVTGGVPPAYSPFEQGNRLPLLDPRNAAYILDGRRHNTSIIDTDGIDVALRYVWDTGLGAMRAGLVANYVFAFDTADVPGAAVEERANYFGNSFELRMRGNLGIDFERLSANAFVNYVNGFDIERQYIPAAAPDEYLSIDSYTTVDLTLMYNFDGLPVFSNGIFEGMRMVFSVQNVFDEDPSLVLNARSPGTMFDPVSANPLGRLATLQLDIVW